MLPCLRKHQHLDLTISFLFLLGRVIFSATLGGLPAGKMRVEAMPIQQAEAEPALMPNHIFINMSSMCIYIYICIYKYIFKTYTHTHLYVYIVLFFYIYIFICLYLYIYIYIYCNW